MGVILSLLAFVVARWFARRSLAHGTGFVLLTGAGYGLVRAHLQDPGSYFLFDSALLGLYSRALPTAVRRCRGAIKPLENFVFVLCALPVLLFLASPFFDSQPLEVQLLGLRAAAFFVPSVLIGFALDEDEWFELSRWSCWVAIACAGLAISELLLGVETFIPVSDASFLVYASNDVVGGPTSLRIPSSFASAHGYSGTMVALLPVIFRAYKRRGSSRLLRNCGTIAASFGALISGARTPMVVLLALLVATALSSLRKPAALAGLGALVLALGLVVPSIAQFRRIETLQDPEVLTVRVEQSVNESFFDIATNAPLGHGLAMAFGTSVPSFLARDAKPQIGLENEYARLAVELGLPGLGLWLAFVLWCIGGPPLKHGTGEFAGWVFCVAAWANGLIGAGILAAIPGTLLLLLQMGRLVRLKVDARSAMATGSTVVMIPSIALASHSSSAE
jgi:hypothetical protein